MKTLVVVVTLILDRSRYQLFQLPVSLSSTCFLDVPFFYSEGVFGGGNIYTTPVVEIKSAALWYITDLPRQTVVYN